MVAYLELVFRNQAGYLVVISVIAPRPDLTAGQNIFTSPGGDLVAKVEARIVEREYVWYNIS